MAQDVRATLERVKNRCRAGQGNEEGTRNDVRSILDAIGFSDIDPYYNVQKRHIVSDFQGRHSETDAFCMDNVNQGRPDWPKINASKHHFNRIQNEITRKRGGDVGYAYGGLKNVPIAPPNVYSWCSSDPTVIAKATKVAKTEPDLRVNTRMGLQNKCEFFTGIPNSKDNSELRGEEVLPEAQRVIVPEAYIHDLPENVLRPAPMPENVIVREEEEKVLKQPTGVKTSTTAIIPDKSTEIIISPNNELTRRIDAIIAFDNEQEKKDERLSYKVKRYDKQLASANRKRWNEGLDLLTEWEGKKVTEDGKHVIDIYNLLERKYRNGQMVYVAPIGLIDNIRSTFRKANIDVTIDDRRVLPPPKPFKIEGYDPFSGKKIKLYPYQKVVVDDAVSRGRGIIELATGAGKTVIATEIIGRLGQDTVFIVPNNSLFANAKMQIYGPEDKPNLSGYINREKVNVGQVGGMGVDLKNDPNKVNINILSLPLAARVLGADATCRTRKHGRATKERPISEEKQEAVKKALKMAGTMVIDEVHHLPACTYREVAKYSPAKYRFGLSATPYHREGKELEIQAGVGRPIGQLKAYNLIHRRKLVAPEIIVIDNSDISPDDDEAMLQNLKADRCLNGLSAKVRRGVEADDFEFPDKGSTQRQRYVRTAAVTCNDPRNQRIVDVVRKLEERDKTTVVFVSSITHGKVVKNMLAENGVDSELLTSETEKDVIYTPEEVARIQKKEKKRVALFERMKKGDLKTIVATNKIMGEGVDVPAIDAIVLTDSGKSKIDAIQMVGRALRKKPGKKVSIIVDFQDDVDYLGKWAKERQKTWKEERFSISRIAPNQFENKITSLIGDPFQGSLTMAKDQEERRMIIKTMRKYSDLKVDGLKTIVTGLKEAGNIEGAIPSSKQKLVEMLAKYEVQSAMKLKELDKKDANLAGK